MAGAAPARGRIASARSLARGPRQTPERGLHSQAMAEMHDATEAYLETILEIEEEGVTPIRARLVERLGLSAPAVSEQVNRLVDQGYAQLLDDRTLKLTASGRALATTIVRRHRLAERLLVDVIGLEWEKVHREADRWEHAISADVEAKLVELLGDPMTCPHGNPIPGTLRTPTLVPTVVLAQAEPGRVTVARVSERLEVDDDAMALIAHGGLIPGSTAEVLDHRDGGVAVRTDAGDRVVPDAIARLLWVETH